MPKAVTTARVGSAPVLVIRSGRSAAGEAERRAGGGGVVDAEVAEGGVAGEGVGGEEGPELLLGRARGGRRGDDAGQRLAVDGVAAGLGGEGEDAGGVAGAAAVVGAEELLGLARLRREAGAAEHGVGAGLVAGEGEGGAELGLGEGGGEGARPGVGVVAQVADGGAALAGEDHEGVGEVFAALLEVAVGVDEVGEVAERRLEGAVGDGGGPGRGRGRGSR